ncbi:MAG: hypothetical protein ACE37B_17415 [Ilumatobacter sp.]|jgi:hypothetical protein|uniref:hypothetical protein n=1 Tax=Ilumatobacter sp. TaxID=1967498 RepID=UPI00391CC236
MSNSTHALRSRAASLRALAAAIETTPAMHLDRDAGIDTWRGPRPAACYRVLIDAQRRVHEAAEELRREAWELELRAEELEYLARVLG